MSTLADIVTAQAALDAEIKTVATDVQALLTKLSTLPADTQAAVDAEVTALRASTNTLSGVATSTGV